MLYLFRLIMKTVMIEAVVILTVISLKKHRESKSTASTQLGKYE